MKHFFAIGFLPLLMAFAFMNTNPTTVTEGGITSSKVEWKGHKVTGSHFGTIDVQSGNLDFDAEGSLTGGMITIDMNTITTADLTGEYADKLVGHLKSDDFFGVANHPTATLKITKVASKGTPGDYKITADVTIKETTKSIKFYANIANEGENKVATADLKIDRTDFNVRYGSGSFFDSLGDKTIYDEFELSVRLVVK